MNSSNTSTSTQIYSTHPNKEIVDISSRIADLGLGCGRLELHGDAIHLLIIKEIRHLARVEDTINVLQEGLLHDVSVGEQEDRVGSSYARQAAYLLEVLAEVDDVVTARQGQFVELTPRDVAGQLDCGRLEGV